MENLAFADLLATVDSKHILAAGKAAALALGLKWSADLASLINCIKNHPDLIPGTITGADLDAVLKVWLKKYQNGLNNRSATRVARPSNVKRDPILKHVLQVSNPSLSVEKIEEIFGNHSLAMAIENNIGNLLEDYIALNLEQKGWISAWGSTLHAVDFYKPKPEEEFLQIKNRSNSENSSSMAIRKGTPIKKWYRINAQNGKTYWAELEKITGVTGMSEEDFSTFIQECISENPNLFNFGETKPD